MKHIREARAHIRSVTWNIIGTDLNGNKTVAGRVRFPENYTKEDVLNSLHRSGRIQYVVVSDVERAQ